MEVLQRADEWRKAVVHVSLWVGVAFGVVEAEEAWPASHFPSLGPGSG